MLTPSPIRSDISQAPKQAVYYVEYDAEHCLQQEFIADGNTPFAPVLPAPQDGQTQWVHCIGINDAATLKNLLAPYHIHELVIEDILSKKQRPKIEDYNDYIFIAARVFTYHAHKLTADQVYLIIGRNFILTFQQHPIGLFNDIRQHLASNRYNIRQKNIDFMAYAFIDRLVDDYFLITDTYNEHVETIDRALFQSGGNNNNDLLIKIHRLKRDALRIRRTLTPIRDVLTMLLRGDFDVFNGESQIYLRDTYDHVLQLIESIDASRDSVLSMMDVYLSFQSNKLNQQIRVLTVVTLLFMPLTVITGIYGMNFENMPELKWHYGYYMVLGLMLLITAYSLYFFRKRNWL